MGDVSSQSVRAQVERVLASAHFSRSPTLSGLLRFVTELTLDGKNDELKEYRLGVDVFGRKADFDPRVDPIVRIQAAKLRARLAEYYANEGRSDSIVVSIPKGGYVPHFSETESTPAAPARATAQGVQSIAVLPFVSMSTDPENEYFTDGLTEELINVLTYVPGLRVVARTSVFCFKNTSQDVREIGTRLNVETVLEGSVRKSGNQLRVTAQLIDVSTGYRLLSRTFPRELKDVFEVQEELAGAVVNEIMPERRRLPKPVARNYTADLELYNLYLKATFVLRNSFTGPRDSIAQFRQVLDRDPGYAPAWAELAWAYCMHAWFGFLPSDKAMSLGRESALKALALDDGLGIAHAMLGMTNAVLDWNWKEAEKHYRRAIEVQPGLAAAHQIYAYTCLMPQRRFQEALAATERALPLNPLDAVLNSSATFTFAVMGHHAAALRQQAINQEANPHHPVVFGSHGFALEVMGRFEEALAEYSNACNLTRRAPFPLGALGHLYAKTGNAGEAEQVLEEFLSQSDPDGVCVALVYVGLRKNSEAFQWMEKAMEARLPHVILIPHDPRFAPLYGDPRYQQILETMGLARAATA